MKGIKFFIVLFLCLGFMHWVKAQDQQDQPKKQEQVEENQVDLGTAESEGSEGNEPLDMDLTAEDEEIATGDFIYKPRGRRDPFWNLLQGKSVKIKREAREGIAGMLIDELELEGILFKNGKYIALFKGPDGRPYDVKVGDSVYDGEVIKIDMNAVVFKRILTIALGGTKEKMITLRLIPEEEASKQ